MKEFISFFDPSPMTLLTYSHNKGPKESTVNIKKGNKINPISSLFKSKSKKKNSTPPIDNKSDK